MQENEFEKNLQHTLDGLQMQPTEEVWLKVKTQVEKKSSKKRFAFLFLFLALLSTTLFFVNRFNTPANESQIAASASQPQASPKYKNREEPVNEEGHNTAVNNINTIPNNTKSQNERAAVVDVALENQNNIKANNTGASNLPFSNGTYTRQVKRKTNGALSATTVSPAVYEDNNNQEQVAAIEEPGFLSKTRHPEMLIETNGDVETKTGLQAANIKQIEITGIKKNIVADKKEEKTTTSSKKKKNKTANRKWGLAFSAMGGMSVVSKGLAQNGFSLDYAGGGIGSSPNAGGGNYSTPPVLNSGIGFTAGIGLYRQLSSSVKFTMGLQYSFNTLSFKPGKPMVVDRVDSIFNTAGEYKSIASSYNQKFHYLQLPVSISVKLGHIAKKEISIEAGATISRLLAGDVLEYNAALNRYVVDAGNLHKTIAGLSLSANINLAGADKPALYIGPQFNYQITPFSAAGLHANRRMGFVGIKVQKNLWK